MQIYFGCRTCVMPSGTPVTWSKSATCWSQKESFPWAAKKQSQRPGSRGRSPLHGDPVSGTEERALLLVRSRALLARTSPKAAEKLKINAIFRSINHPLTTLVLWETDGGSWDWMEHFGYLSSKLMGKFLCLRFLVGWPAPNAGPLSCSTVIALKWFKRAGFLPCTSGIMLWRSSEAFLSLCVICVTKCTIMHLVSLDLKALCDPEEGVYLKLWIFKAGWGNTYHAGVCHTN